VCVREERAPAISIWHPPRDFSTSPFVVHHPLQREIIAELIDDVVIGGDSVGGWIYILEVLQERGGVVNWGCNRLPPQTLAEYRQSQKETGDEEDEDISKEDHGWVQSGVNSGMFKPAATVCPFSKILNLGRGW